MLDTHWEAYSTELANAPTTAAFVEALQRFVKVHKVDLSKPAKVLYARDTRPSGPSLVHALEDGLKSMGAEVRNEGVQTTPILHYLVRCVNTKGTKEAYGDDSVDGYMTKMTDAFKKLVVSVFDLPGYIHNLAHMV